MGRRKGKSKKDSKWSGTDHTRRSGTARCAIIGNSYFSALGFVMNDIAFRMKMIFFFSFFLSFFSFSKERAKFLLLLNWAVYPGQEGRGGGRSLGNFFYSWIFLFTRINSHPVKFSIPFQYEQYIVWNWLRITRIKMENIGIRRWSITLFWKF